MDNAANGNSGNAIRCLHIASGDLWAGAEVQVCNLLSRLRRMDGIEPFAVILNEGELARRLRQADVPVTVLDETRLSTWQILKEVRQIVRRERIGILHSHRRKEHLIGALAARLHGRVSIRTVHGRNEHPATGWNIRAHLLERVDRFVARFLQRRIIAVSEVLGAELAREFPPGRVIVVPNGVELEPLERLARENPRRPLEGRPMEVAVVGRLVPVKRLDLVIRIAAELNRSHPGMFRFLVYGDGPLRETLESQAASALPREILAFEGFRADVTRRLAGHDALLIASDHEGLPTNLLEALSLGMPVVARAVGEIPLVMGEGLEPFCVKSEDPADFACQLVAAREGIVDGSLDQALFRARATRYDATAGAQRHRSLYAALGRSRPETG